MKDIIKYNDFTGSVHFSADDDIFFGKIERIDDLVTFEGSSVAELKKAFTQAVEDYLELCSLKGKAPQKNYNGSFNVRIKPELHKKIALKARDEGINMNQFVQKALEREVA